MNGKRIVPENLTTTAITQVFGSNEYSKLDGDSLNDEYDEENEQDEGLDNQEDLTEKFNLDEEKISLNVWIARFIATVGIIIIALGNTEKNSLLGLIFGMTSSIGFSVFSVTLRWNKETPKFTTVAFAGLFCFVVAAIVILTNDMVFLSTSYNGALFSIHGTLVCMGLILYSIGSKAIPAAELTLLSLTEVIGGIFWVWIPILGINEIPSTNTIIGGFFLFMSIIYYSLTIKTNRRFIALN